MDTKHSIKTIEVSGKQQTVTNTALDTKSGDNNKSTPLSKDAIVAWKVGYVAIPSGWAKACEPSNADIVVQPEQPDAYNALHEYYDKSCHIRLVYIELSVAPNSIRTNHAKCSMCMEMGHENGHSRVYDATVKSIVDEMGNRYGTMDEKDPYGKMHADSVNDEPVHMKVGDRMVFQATIDMDDYVGKCFSSDGMIVYGSKDDCVTWGTSHSIRSFLCQHKTVYNHNGEDAFLGSPKEVNQARMWNHYRSFHLTSQEQELVLFMNDFGLAKHLPVDRCNVVRPDGSSSMDHRLPPVGQGLQSRSHGAERRTIGHHSIVRGRRHAACHAHRQMSEKGVPFDAQVACGARESRSHCFVGR